jgi:glycerol uptake facilitator-like aquaporin
LLQEKAVKIFNLFVIFGGGSVAGLNLASLVSTANGSWVNVAGGVAIALVSAVYVMKSQ